MAKLRLSKTALAKERQSLKLYERLLPSLDLKRRQLTIEGEKARVEHNQAQAQAKMLEADLGHKLPMIANPNIDLRGLAKLRRAEIGVENVVGVKLPVLKRVEYEFVEYSFISTPAWVDELVTRMQEAIELHLRIAVAAKRVAALEYAVRRITQRVNLFGRILIPNAQRNIKRIRVFLGDLERDAVIRSKLVKRKGLLHRPGNAGSEHAP